MASNTTLPQRLKILTVLFLYASIPGITKLSFTPSPFGEKPCGINGSHGSGSKILGIPSPSQSASNLKFSFLSKTPSLSESPSLKSGIPSPSVSLGSFGSEPASSLSFTPSLSESRSWISGVPSPSVSTGFLGSGPTSEPSLIPSLSESTSR